MKNLFKILLFLGLALLPLIYFPNADLSYEIPRVIIFQRGVLALVLVFWLISAQKIKIQQAKLILLGLFFTIALIASWWGVDAQKSFRGNFYRSDGLVTLVHLISFCVVISLAYLQRLERIICAGICSSGLLLSFWGIIQTIIGFTQGEISVISLSFGNPNFLGGYLLVTLPYWIYFSSHFKRRWGIVGALVQMGAIFLTQSTGSILGLVIFAGGLTCFQYPKWWKKFSLVLLILAFLGLGFFLSQTPDSMAESRQRIFTKLFLAFKERPILGYGWSNVDYAFEKIVWPIKYSYDVYVDKAHSSFLEILITTGLVGLLSFLLLIFYTLRNLFEGVMSQNKSNSLWSQTLLLSFLLFLFHAQTNVISISEELIFWLVLGLAGREANSNSGA